MSSLVLATGNLGKLKEFQRILAPLSLELLPQSALSVSSVDETGLSFIENALLKARHCARHTQLPALADDSGLVVDGLGGAPGIYSARYGGVDATDKDRYEKILYELSRTPKVPRTARFYCVIAYLNTPDDPTPIICEGAWEGEILLEPKGENGFGYDPIFYVPEYDCSAAQLDPDIKNKISHRGKAMGKLLKRL